MPKSTEVEVTTAKPVADAYVDILAEEGYRPKIERGESDDTSTVIHFKSEGIRYRLFAYEDDPEYFRLGVSYDLGEGPHDAALLARIANDVNDRLKGVKAVLGLDQNGVRFVVESFLTGQKVTAALVERATSALRSAADDFFAARRPPDHLDA